MAGLLPRPPPQLEKGLPKCPSAVRRSPCPPPAPSHQQKGHGGEAAWWPSYKSRQRRTRPVEQRSLSRMRDF
ncbi:hypothetical protein CgunFtcFv8_015953 [Champsocephalus gunnari]|uniref:Uncharacterized protein n=1 Tax=Champsocephalus gunnari TaxID=52237 RepID=A0AAN8CAT0_CHAGU|nr:hypothetical protein CgunFtcFv8_015953 [Champsocephalus gunnari]